MDEFFARFFGDLVERVSGPMKFRLLLQPMMASIFATIDGLRDARSNRPPYFWGLLKDAEHRREMELDGWHHVGKVFILALILDVVYQVDVSRFVYPGEAIVVAIVLAIVPYLILRGTVHRLARWW